MSESDWEQEFDTLFTDIVLMEVKPGVFIKKRLLVTFLNDDGERFKYFIKQLLSTQKEQYLEELKDISNKINDYRKSKGYTDEQSIEKV